LRATALCQIIGTIAQLRGSATIANQDWFINSA